MLHARGIMASRLVAGEEVPTSSGSGAPMDSEPRVSVLHPPGEFLDRVDNANSLTLLVSYAGRSCLLPGDLEKNGMERLLLQPAIDCDVLMAPHHGSTTQDPLPIIRWCQPEWIIISGGPRAAQPKVSQRYSPPGTRCLVTHLDGAIQCCIRSRWSVARAGWNVSAFDDVTQ